MVSKYRDILEPPGPSRTASFSSQSGKDTIKVYFLKNSIQNDFEEWEKELWSKKFFPTVGIAQMH